ncbi:hypothetical protein [Nocardia goodfellowii]|uniref:DUF2637 domain-containing protein n=1 Tax=Nocardia goodfellowii TaxID=882446 RepID=A0ABS4QTX7_9NOCA|nr:hypothetical protein [Nocardia goodfellowii]MBP2194558.1 hypothetical protein [Nocardia goodfellowii]
MISRDTRTARSTEPVDEVHSLAQRLETERGRRELLGGDATHVLTETPTEAELAKLREAAQWRRGKLLEAERADLADQLAAAEELRKASAEIRAADIRDAVDARKALAAQRRAETPASTIAELHRYSRWTRYAIAVIIGIGMIWSAINVQKNAAPGGTSDPLFWASYLLEAMISGLLIIIALGTAKMRDTADVEAHPLTRLAEVALFVLTFGLNVYPYVRAGDWYQTVVHGIAPAMIGLSLVVLHSMGAGYAKSRAKIAEKITGAVELPELPALHTVHRAPAQDTVHPAVSYRTEQPDETVHPEISETVHALETVHRAPETGTAAAHPDIELGDETVQLPRTAQEAPRHRAGAPVAADLGVRAEQLEVHTEQRAEQPATVGDHDDTDHQEQAEAPARTAAAVAPRDAAETEQPEPEHRALENTKEGQRGTAGDRDPGAAVETVHTDTVQLPRTEQEGAQEDTAHRAPRPETVHRAAEETVQDTVQVETVHRAPATATDPQNGSDAHLRLLAAEVHGRLSRTRFAVEDVARVLIANRRDGLGADRIYRDKIGPHRDTTRNWIQLADEIEAERAASMAPVVRLRG